MSEKINYKLISTSGSEAGSIELNPEVFGKSCDPSLIHQVVRLQLNNRRSGSHATLNLSKMDKSMKKPYRQKGTGRARAGSRYAPNRVGGAVAHGPQPRDYGFKLNRKQKRIALLAVLSSKCAEQQLCIVDKLEISEAKTKLMAEMVKAVKPESAKKSLLIYSDAPEMQDAEAMLKQAGKNIATHKAISVNGLNVYDLINADCLIFDQATVKEIEKRFQGSGE